MRKLSSLRVARSPVGRVAWGVDAGNLAELSDGIAPAQSVPALEKHPGQPVSAGQDRLQPSGLASRTPEVIGHPIDEEWTSCGSTSDGAAADHAGGGRGGARAGEQAWSRGRAASGTSKAPRSASARSRPVRCSGAGSEFVLTTEEIVGNASRASISPTKACRTTPGPATCY